METTITDDRLQQLADELRSTKLGLFATYGSMRELEGYVSRLNGPEGAVAATTLGITFNTVIEQVAGFLEREAQGIRPGEDHHV
jgi:hypothetical protein